MIEKINRLYVGERVYNYLLTGMTYREIAQKYYCRDENKFVTELRKIMKGLRVQNRRQLVFLAYEDDLYTA